MSLSLRHCLLVVVLACSAILAATVPAAPAQSGGSVGDVFDSGGSATGVPATEDPGGTGSPPPDPSTDPPPAEPPSPVGTPPPGSEAVPGVQPVPMTASPTPVAAQSPDSGAAQPSSGATLSPALPSAPAGVGPRVLEPFPVVRIRGRITRTGASISLLLVRAPVGARVSLRCRGRACPMRRLARATTARSLRVRSFERHLGAGTLVEVFVTRPGLIGKYTRFRIRRRGAPARTDLCLVPGQRAPRACS